MSKKAKHKVPKTPTKKDYYQVLEVPKDADEAAIKKAYKKLALKHHPDKNPDNKVEAEEKFKEIAEAFSVLGNKEKREVYDKYGFQGLEQNTGMDQGGFADFDDFGGFHSAFSFADANNIFKQFFGGSDPFQFFDDDDEDFGFGKFGGAKFGKKGEDMFGGFGSMGFGGFDDEDDGFPSHKMGGMGGCKSVSTSSSTIIKNGQKIKKTETTTIDSHGNKTIKVTEEVVDHNGNISRKEQTKKLQDDSYPDGNKKYLKYSKKK